MYDEIDDKIDLYSINPRRVVLSFFLIFVFLLNIIIWFYDPHKDFTREDIIKISDQEEYIFSPVKNTTLYLHSDNTFIQGNNSKYSVREYIADDTIFTHILCTEGFVNIYAVSNDGNLSYTPYTLWKNREAVVYTDKNETGFLRFEADGKNPSIDHGLYFRPTSDKTDFSYKDIRRTDEEYSEKQPIQWSETNVSVLYNTVENNKISSSYLLLDYEDEDFPVLPKKKDFIKFAVIFEYDTSEKEEEEKEELNEDNIDEIIEKESTEDNIAEIIEEESTQDIITVKSEEKLLENNIENNKDISVNIITEKNEYNLEEIEKTETGKEDMKTNDNNIPKYIEALVIDDNMSILDAGDELMTIETLTIHENFPGNVVKIKGYIRVKNLILLSSLGDKKEAPNISGTTVLDTKGYFKILPGSTFELF